MAYETKVILKLLANQVIYAKTAKEAYNMIRSAAQVEGMVLPKYEDAMAELHEDEEE